MARFEKENIRVYDEPVIYSSFTGGINNTPSNESMSDNELRDAVNWHYNETVLERRLGAKIIADLSKVESMPGTDYENMQGAFAYGIGESTYIILVVDGRIFYSKLREDIMDTVDYMVPPLDISEIVITCPSGKEKNINGGGQINITGKPDNEFEGLVLYKDTDNIPKEHNGYLVYGSGINKLICQNTKLVEGIGINDEFRLASGTRLIRIYEDGGVLKGEVVKPHYVSSWEYGNIGMNRLSPYPLQAVKATNNAASTSINVILVGNLNKQTQDTFDARAIVDFPAGKSANDYYFKWEFMRLNSQQSPLTEWTAINNGVQRLFKDAGAKGLDKISGVKASSFGASPGDFVRIRCTFAEDFERVNVMESGNTSTKSARVTETVKTNTDSTGGYELDSVEDYKYDVIKLFGSTHVELSIVSTVPALAPDQFFLDIHSSRKLISDGNNIIYYDDYRNTGNWYKTVTEKYDYITDKGSLNFQTNKNESLIKAINFEGNIVCFAYNPEIGGNISVVMGSGDDYDSKDGYYSPYRRKIANTNITTDHPNTVQVAENNLIFKFRDSVYLIESKQLDADRVDVIPVNDKLKHYTWLKDSSEYFDTNTMVQMPNVHNNKLFLGTPYEKRVFSEVTEDYYSLIFPEQKLRWKMYFKLPIKYQNDPKVYYPWLRDTSHQAFNIFGVLYLKGVSTLVTKNSKIIQFTSLDYKDLGADTFKSSIYTKAFDLNYPKFVKYLQNLNVYYYRDYSRPFTLNLELKNESDLDIYGIVYKAFHEYAEDEDKETIVDRIVYRGVQPIDKEILIADVTNIDNAVLGPQPRYTSKVFTPINMKPFLSVSVKLDIEDATNVTIGSIGFSFVTAHLPDESMQNYYGEIIPF